MNFNDFIYKRADIYQLQESIRSLITSMNNSSNFEEFKRLLIKINILREDFLTNCDIAKTRYNMNSSDSFYSEEVDFINNIMPLYEELISELYTIILNSPFKQEIENQWGSQLIRIAEQTVKTISPVIIEDLKKENMLANEYSKLMASAKIEYNGKELTLSQITNYITSFNREVRKSASKAKYSYFQRNSEKLDQLFNSLVLLRDKVAKDLGYENYIDLGYARLLRSTYNASDVKRFREQILEFIVPLSVKLRERQRQRLKLDVLKHYDESLVFTDGNPKPLGKEDFIRNISLEVFNKISKDTGEFFDLMNNANLMDLESRKNKRVGGYCTYFYKHKAPFIFTNFNGTAGDVKVLSHEVGHAFQAYLSRNSDILEYISPTLESCEIHSMSMEYFVWPWVDKYFGKDATRYKYEHLSSSINNLCYMACVDEFQHIVYEKPDISPKERKDIWRELEKKYMPNRVYDENNFLAEGGFWQQQRHIYIYPFYYIDYALAQVCALQFWKMSNRNPDYAWGKYIELCKAGGAYAFTDLIQIAGLKSPFEEGCVKDVIADIEQWFSSIAETDL